MDEQFYDSNNSYENPSQEIPVYTPPTPKKREKKSHVGLRICALALVFALLGGALSSFVLEKEGSITNLPTEAQLLARYETIRRDD